jgi:hypothetical protein
MMPTRTVCIRSSLDLPQTANRVFRALSIENWEERDSDNHPDGIYFRGTAGELTVKVSSYDALGFEDYPFLIAILAPSTFALGIDELVDLMVVDLLKAGFEVARRVKYTRGLMERERFSLDECSNLVRTAEKVAVPDEDL